MYMRPAPTAVYNLHTAQHDEIFGDFSSEKTTATNIEKTKKARKKNWV